MFSSLEFEMMLELQEWEGQKAEDRRQRTEGRGQRHRVHIYSPSLQGRKHLQSLPLPKRNNINSKKKS